MVYQIFRLLANGNEQLLSEVYSSEAAIRELRYWLDRLPNAIIDARVVTATSALKFAA